MTMPILFRLQPSKRHTNIRQPRTIKPTRTVHTKTTDPTSPAVRRFNVFFRQAVAVWRSEVWCLEKYERDVKVVFKWTTSKAVLTHAMRHTKWSGGSGPLILNLGTIWRWVVRLTPRPFYTRCPAGLDFWPKLLFLSSSSFFFIFFFSDGTPFQCGPSPP
jgi:hypothetical protein